MMQWLLLRMESLVLGRGYRAGYLAGVAAADREWALMLENDMVGPGLPHHPIRGESA